MLHHDTIPVIALQIFINAIVFIGQSSYSYSLRELGNFIVRERCIDGCGYFDVIRH